MVCAASSRRELFLVCRVVCHTVGTDSARWSVELSLSGTRYSLVHLAGLAAERRHPLVRRALSVA